MAVRKSFEEQLAEAIEEKPRRVRKPRNAPVLAPIDPPKPRRARKVTAPEPVTVIKVNPSIWKTALQLADGKPSRIKVISATKVEVSS